MDTLTAVNLGLAGLFGFAAIHYAVTWRFSRDEQMHLFFSLQCALYVIICLHFASYFRSTTVAEAQGKIDRMVTLGAIAHTVVLHFYALLVGRRDGLFRWLITGVKAV